LVAWVFEDSSHPSLKEVIGTEVKALAMREWERSGKLGAESEVVQVGNWVVLVGGLAGVATTVDADVEIQAAEQEAMAGEERVKEVGGSMAQDYED